MKALILPFAVAALIGWNGVTFGQPTTCSQQLASCERGCDNASITLKAAAAPIASAAKETAWLRD
jgi:hypothetical protein